MELLGSDDDFFLLDALSCPYVQVERSLFSEFEEPEQPAVTSTGTAAVSASQCLYYSVGEFIYCC